MPTTFDFQWILYLAGAIVTLGTAYLTIKKVINANKSEKKAQANEILKCAREEIGSIEQKLLTKIQIVEDRIEILEKDVNKDITHLKESYSNEIKSLGEKIENLREELRVQHANLLNLIMKLVEK